MCISVLLQSGSVEKISNLQVKQVLARVLLNICLHSFRKKKKKNPALKKKKDNR